MKIKPLLLSVFSLILIFASITIYLMRVNLSGYFYGNTDFFKFYQSVRFYFAGQDIYSYSIIKEHSSDALAVAKWITANGNLNPPFLTLLLLPFYYVSYASALKIWTAVSIFLMALSAILTLSAFPQWRLKTWHYLIIMAAFLIYLPNSITLAFGQITAYVLAPLVGAWLAARQRQEVLAGFFIGLACSIKVFCGLFFVYFLVFRRLRLLISASITYLVSFLLALVLFGYQAYQHYETILSKITWYAANWNASILGYFTRLFSSSEGNSAIVNLPFLVHPFTTLCSVIVLGMLLLVWNRLYRYSIYHNTDALDIGFALTLIAMLLLSPLAWLYYFPILIISYLILIDQSRYLKNGIFLQLLAIILLIFTTLTGDYEKTFKIHSATEILLNSGYAFYTLVILFIIFIYIYRQRVNQQFLQKYQSLFISENLWLLIYACAFIPSLLSLIYITKNLYTFILPTT